MEIATKKEKNSLVISIKGRMDAVSAPEFEKAAAEQIAQGEKSIVVDLGALEYISSAGLRSMLMLAKQIKEKQGNVAFAALKGPVQDVFKMSGFYSIFKIHDTVESALAQG